MKRISLILLIALASFFCFLPPRQTAHAEVSSNSLILLLVENHDQDQIDIDVKLVTNTGVSAMTLELDYEKDVFEFVGYEKGTALDGLDLISTNRSEDDTLPVKFNWFPRNNDVKNDESVGVILKLRFTLKDGARNGKHGIGFKYNSGDIAYVANGNVVAKSAIISKALISMTDNKISDVEIIDGETQEALEPWVIAVVATTSILVLATAVILIVKIIQKRRGKGNWSKI